MTAQHVELEGCDCRPGVQSAPLVELVDDNPAADIRRNVRQEKGEVAFKIVAVFCLAKSAQLFKPKGMGKMVQGDKNLDAPGLQQFQQLQVMAQGILVEAPFHRLDAAPLDGHTIALVPKLGQQFHILPEQAVMVAGLT